MSMLVSVMIWDLKRLAKFLHGGGGWVGAAVSLGVDPKGREL